jgi:hypothetical protein
VDAYQRVWRLDRFETMEIDPQRIEGLVIRLEALK